MATFTGKATGNWDDAGQTTWNEVDFPIAGDDVTSNAIVVDLDSNEACASLIVSASGEVDLNTYNLIMTGSATVQAGAKLRIGFSSDQGLECLDYTVAAGGSNTEMDLQTSSRIEILNGGSYTAPDARVFTNVNRGKIVFLGTGNISDPNYLNRWYIAYTGPASAVTLTGNWFASDFLPSMSIFDLNGTLDMNGNNLYTGVATNFWIGSGGDVLGTGNWNTWLSTSTNCINSMAAAFTGTFTLYMGFNSGSSNRRNPPGNFTNNDVYINDIGSGDRGFQFYDNFICKSLTNDGDTVDTITIDNTTGNGNITVLNNIELNAAGGTVVYNAGTGLLTLTNTSGTHTIALDGKSVEDIVLNCNGAIKQFTENFTTQSLTITAGTADLTTINATSSGLTDVSGTLKIGTSAGTGLTTAGITFQLGSFRDWQEGSIINCSSNWTEPNGDISTNNNRGTVTLTGNGNISKINGQNYFYSFTVAAGVTTTVSSTSFITNNNSKEVIINGTLAVNSSAIIGASSAISGNNFTIGVNGDISGSQEIRLLSTTVNFTNNRATAFSFTGTLTTPDAVGTDNIAFPAWDFSNGDVTVKGGSSAGRVRIITAGTLKCINLTYTHYNNNNYTQDNATYNPSFEVSGNLLIVPGAGVITYNKSTGIYTLTGSSGTQTISCNGKSMEAFVFNCAGATKEVSEDFSTVSISGTGGTVQSTVAGAQRTITTAGTGVCSNMTFKDISTGSAFQINAKNGCIHNGNNKGIVFNDYVE